jgi:hypothetical protein
MQNYKIEIKNKLKTVSSVCNFGASSRGQLNLRLKVWKMTLITLAPRIIAPIPGKGNDWN